MEDYVIHFYDVCNKYREPTEEEIRYYAQVIARKILHVK